MKSLPIITKDQEIKDLKATLTKATNQLSIALEQITTQRKQANKEIIEALKKCFVASVMQEFDKESYENAIIVLDKYCGEEWRTETRFEFV
jgi:hypothetical protein